MKLNGLIFLMTVPAIGCGSDKNDAAASAGPSGSLGGTSSTTTIASGAGAGGVSSNDTSSGGADQTTTGGASQVMIDAGGSVSTGGHGTGGRKSSATGGSGAITTLGTGGAAQSTGGNASGGRKSSATGGSVAPSTGGAVHPTGGSGNPGTTTGGNPSDAYTLPADRGTAWNNAGLLTKGGIPSATWTVCNATPLTPSTGSDDSAQINAQIASCAAGTVVQLGAGTFKMGQGKFVLINKGVVLRGAGAGVTILKNSLNGPATQSVQTATDATPIVIVGPARWAGPDGDGNCNGLTAYQPAYMQTLSADGNKGDTSVTVADGAIFKNAKFVLLDETSNAAWQPDIVKLSTSVWASSDYAVQWHLHNPALSNDDLKYSAITPSTSNNWAGIGNGKDGACWFSRQDRPQNEIKEIDSVSGNTVSFKSPLHKAYRIANHAELTTYTGDRLHVQNAGVENLSMVGGGDGALRFKNAAYSWAKNVEVSTWYGEGIALDSSYRVEVRDSYIHDASYPEPGGGAYAISISAGSSELLIENNISIRANKVMVARSSGTGSVVGYNYMDDGYISTSESWVEIGLNASHMVGPHHVLFEGNQSFNMDNDDTHGNSTYHTYFRNWATSTRTKFQAALSGHTIDDANSTDSAPKRAGGAMRYTYWLSFVGNILGQSGVTTSANGYVDESDSMAQTHATIWLLGWNDINPYTPDPNVAATAIRDGNWDWLLGKQTWLSNSAQPLPNSFYLSAKPAFFGANTWPWVDPSTGTVYTLPAKARYDSGNPNTLP